MPAALATPLPRERERASATGRAEAGRRGRRRDSPPRPERAVGNVPLARTPALRHRRDIRRRAGGAPSEQTHEPENPAPGLAADENCESPVRPASGEEGAEEWRRGGASLSAGSIGAGARESGDRVIG